MNDLGEVVLASRRLVGDDPLNLFCSMAIRADIVRRLVNDVFYRGTNRPLDGRLQTTVGITRHSTKLIEDLAGGVIWRGKELLVGHGGIQQWHSEALNARFYLSRDGWVFDY